MNKSTRSNILLAWINPWITGWLCLCLLGVFLAVPETAHASQGESILEIIRQANAPFDQDSVDSVYPLSEKTVRARDHQGGTFRVLARTEFIERYKCTTCHKKKKVNVNKGAELTHGDVKIKHGEGDNELVCVDCHHAVERDFLEDKKGRKIDLDHSYQLCGQCHFRQKRDWLGGAHGKRVKYWAGERVIRNCTTCHNPHSPRFKKRMPATYSLPLD